MNPNSEIKQLSSSYFVKSGERNSGPGGEYNGDFIEDYEYIPNSGSGSMQWPLWSHTRIHKWDLLLRHYRYIPIHTTLFQRHSGSIF